MSAPPTHTSRPLALTTVLKAVADSRELCVVGALTSPGLDRAGDRVRPEGLDFTSHRQHPVVDLEHARDPDVRDAVVGWCRKSLGRPGGDYGVRWSTVDVPGHGPTRLPFARTWFDPNDRLQSQVFSLYEQGALTGYSLEFRPVAMKAIGWSDLDRRPAYDFERCDVVRYTCCAVPVCDGALIAADGVIRKSLSGQVPEPLRKILTDGRVGGEMLHPVIAKAYRLAPPTRTVVRVEKAMDEQDTVYDDAAPDVTGADDHDESDGDEGGEATPTAQAAYDAAQMLTDACQQIRDALGKSEHVAGKKKLMTLCDQIEKVAEKATAVGDMVAADVGGDGDMDADDEEPDLEPDAMQVDEEGVIKALSDPRRRVYRKAVRRFTVAEITKGMDRVPREDPAVAAARKRNERLKRELEELMARNGR